jgi:hypothetical protein
MIREELKKIYLKLLFPFLILIVLIYLGQFLGIFGRIEKEFGKALSVTLLVLTALFSVALPIFYRSLFANKVKDMKSITVNEFLKFEKNLIIIAMIAPYFVVFTVLLNLSGFYFGTIVIIALYAVYYYYPSEKRVKFEKKLFRISELES